MYVWVVYDQRSKEVFRGGVSYTRKSFFFFDVQFNLIARSPKFYLRVFISKSELFFVRFHIFITSYIGVYSSTFFVLRSVQVQHKLAIHSVRKREDTRHKPTKNTKHLRPSPPRGHQHTSFSACTHTHRR
jgi:hypothetical protein